MHRVFLVCCLVFCLAFLLSACQTGQPTDTLTLSTPSVVAMSTQVRTVTPITSPTETQLPTDTPTPTEHTPTAVPTKGKTIVVNSTADSGSGTLRQALLDSQRGDTITFDPTVFPVVAPATIYLDGCLPPISQGYLAISAVDAGVILDGSNIGDEWCSGLEINSDWNTIQGLWFDGFLPGAGITLTGGAEHNLIGGEKNIGENKLGQGNIVSHGDIGIGISGEGTSLNIITGNFVGIDTGGTDLGNSGSGFWIENGATLNVIGPDNVIAYNGVYGIEILDSNTAGNTITKNSIHNNIRGGISLLGIGKRPERPGGNIELPSPIIFDFDLMAGTAAGYACAGCVIEIFSSDNGQGHLFEGQTTADSNGSFAISQDEAFFGPSLTATATDDKGNTSGFSAPTIGSSMSISLQNENFLPVTAIQPKESSKIADNRIVAEMGGYDDGYGNPEYVFGYGFKWARISSATDALNWQNVEVTPGVYKIDPAVDQVITEYANNGITLILNLGVGFGEDRPDTTRFKTEEDIERYVDYVLFMVGHFIDRIAYFEIWNEPNIPITGAPWGGIELNDYTNLVIQVTRAIKNDFPEARIVAGVVSGEWLHNYPGYGEAVRNTFDKEYLFDFLKSGVVSTIDVISWHPFYGNLPEDPYYQDYQQLVKEIQEIAVTQGFEGEYLVEEMVWRTADDPLDQDLPRFSETVVGKYYARSIVMHRGMDVIAGIALHAAYDMVRNLNYVMAGAEPVEFPVKILSDADNIMNYGFSLPEGDLMIALWTNDTANDNDPGTSTTLIFPNSSAGHVIGIDVLHGFEQELITSTENGNLVIHDLFMKDYPLILRLSE